ncbi:MAG: hypothetical protein EOP45_09685 [Sphingobacteriaceae bacterium]|nr:MAG: hypothetical protein EOP45_09685 [Sphingobacteriaceae bacterium]
MIITVYNPLPILSRSRGTDLPKPKPFSKSEFKSLLMDPTGDGASQNWILSHKGGCQFGISKMIRKVYEYKGGGDGTIRCVPVAEYAKTLTDHGRTIDL